MIDSGSPLVLAAELGRYAMKVAFNETFHMYRGGAIKATKYHHTFCCYVKKRKHDSGSLHLATFRKHYSSDIKQLCVPLK